MEKRRRARINESLGQLKTLIMEALKKDVRIKPPQATLFIYKPNKIKTCLLLQSSRHSKLEKADILEMTVKHLRNLQRLQMAGMCSCAVIIFIKVILFFTIWVCFFPQL